MPFNVNGIPVENVNINTVPADKVNVNGIEAWSAFESILDTMVNGAVGELQADHVMDSGHRWIEQNDPPNEAEIIVFGGGPSGRSLGKIMPSGQPAPEIAGSTELPASLPDKITVNIRMEYQHNTISIGSVLLLDSLDGSICSLFWAGLDVSADPSTFTLFVGGAQVWQVNTSEHGLDYYIIMELTIDIVNLTVTVKTTLNGAESTSPAFPLSSADASNIGYSASNGESAGFGGGVGISRFSVDPAT